MIAAVKEAGGKRYRTTLGNTFRIGVSCEPEFPCSVTHASNRDYNRVRCLEISHALVAKYEGGKSGTSVDTTHDRTHPCNKSFDFHACIHS